MTGEDGLVTYTDDDIKTQGLVGDYSVPLRAVVDVSMETRNIPTETVDDEQVSDEAWANDLLGGEGEEAELDNCQDTFHYDNPLVPEGLLLTDEGEVDYDTVPASGSPGAFFSDAV